MRLYRLYNMLSTAKASMQEGTAQRYVQGLRASWDPPEGANSMRVVSGSVETLRYAHKNGCPWGNDKLSDFPHSTAGLRYVHENGCPFDNAKHNRSTNLNDFDLVH